MRREARSPSPASQRVLVLAGHTSNNRAMREEQAPGDDDGEGARPSYRAVLALLIAAEFASALSGGSIYNALAKLYEIYGDPARVSWLLTANALSSAASAILVARLGDMYGRARMLKLMLLALLVGCLVSLASTNLTVIIIGRAIQGLSMAILPLAFGLLREHAPSSRDLNFGVGLLGGIYSFSTGAAFIISGAVIDWFGWQHIFTVGAIPAAIALVLTWRYLPDLPREYRRAGIDWIGTTFVFPICGLLLSFNFGKSYGWLSAPTLGLLGSSIVALIAWSRYELRRRDPLVDLRLLSNPTIALVNASIFFMAMGPLAYPQVVMPLLQQPVWTGVGLGISATLAGVLKLPTNLSSGAAGIGAGLYARHHSMRPPVIAACAANVIAFALLAVSHSSLIFVLAVCVLLASPAVTIMFACAPGLIIEAAPADRTSEVTGLSSVLRSMGQAIGAQLAGLTLASSRITDAAGTSFPDTTAYVRTFGLVALLSFGSLVFAVLIPKRPRPAVALAH